MGFNAAELKFPRGRPASRWNPDEQRERELKARLALKPAGPLRAQAALALLRTGLLPSTVLDRAADQLRDHARAEAPQGRSARRARGAAAVYRPDELELARQVARMLPSRPRGAQCDDETEREARAVESETRRLKNADDRALAEHKEYIREAVEWHLRPLHAAQARLTAHLSQTAGHAALARTVRAYCASSTSSQSGHVQRSAKAK